VRQQYDSDYKSAYLAANDAQLVRAYEFATIRSLQGAGFVPYGTFYDPENRAVAALQGRFGMVQLQEAGPGPCNLSGMVVPVELPFVEGPGEQTMKVLVGRFLLREQGVFAMPDTQGYCGMVLTAGASGEGEAFLAGLQTVGESDPGPYPLPAATALGGSGVGGFTEEADYPCANFGHEAFVRMTAFRQGEPEETFAYWHVSRDGLGWTLLGSKAMGAVATHYGVAMEGHGVWLCDWLREYEYRVTNAGTSFTPAVLPPPTGARVWSQS
jgi:hypothetical protein